MYKLKILYCVFLISCGTKQKHEANSIESVNKSGDIEEISNELPSVFLPKQPPSECSDTPMPEYDEIIVSLLDESGERYKDTIINRIAKRRTIFKPCREYKFNATLIDKDGNLISESKVSMMATGNRWGSQPELQDEVILKYEYQEEDIIRINKYQINKKLANPVWIRSTLTGVIENVEQIWIHPFRSNQFLFTEVAPFPEIKWPLKKGKSWSGTLSIGNGWGDWDNSSGNLVYKVIEQVSIQTPFGQIYNCWHIASEATYPFGKSSLDFWFSEELGFVKMHYTNYGDQKLNFELIEVIEN